MSSSGHTYTVKQYGAPTFNTCIVMFQIELFVFVFVFLKNTIRINNVDGGGQKNVARFLMVALH
jgi:hypothetical protein